MVLKSKFSSLTAWCFAAYRSDTTKNYLLLQTGGSGAGAQETEGDRQQSIIHADSDTVVVNPYPVKPQDVRVYDYTKELSGMFQNSVPWLDSTGQYLQVMDFQHNLTFNNSVESWPEGEPVKIEVLSIADSTTQFASSNYTFTVDLGGVLGSALQIGATRYLANPYYRHASATFIGILKHWFPSITIIASTQLLHAKDPLNPYDGLNIHFEIRMSYVRQKMYFGRPIRLYEEEEEPSDERPPRKLVKVGLFDRLFGCLGPRVK